MTIEERLAILESQTPVLVLLVADHSTWNKVWECIECSTGFMVDHSTWPKYDREEGPEPARFIAVGRAWCTNEGWSASVALPGDVVGPYIDLRAACEMLKNAINEP